jgi:hypothetical protein
MSLHSRSMSGINSVVTSHASPPLPRIRPSDDTTRHSNTSRDTDPSERSSNGLQSSSRVTSPGSPSTPDTLPTPPSTDNTFLSLNTSESQTDIFNLNIDFTEFENTKIDLPKQQNSTRITNHEFLLLIDDGPGIDHRAWDTICDLVYGVTKRLLPTTSKDPSQIQDLPPSAPKISIRFVNNYRHVPRVYNLNQIRHIFNWVTPRDAAKHPQRNNIPPRPTQTPPMTPPIRTLEYYFWSTYNEKLQKNAWVGKEPTTIILFSSSPLSNRPEDMDLFVAKCAEKLNANHVPLPMMSIIVVQCNVDVNLQRQLVDTKRMIVSEMYTPKIKLPPQTTRKSRGSMLNPVIAQARVRPQRDWVDIVTCVEWQHAGLQGIKIVIEEEIQRGIQRRKKVQKEAALDYLTHLGKESSQVTIHEDPRPISIDGYIESNSRDGSPARYARAHNGHTNGNGHASMNGHTNNSHGKPPPVRDHVYRNDSGSSIEGDIPTGRISYYD